MVKFTCLAFHFRWDHFVFFAWSLSHSDLRVFRKSASLSIDKIVFADNSTSFCGFAFRKVILMSCRDPQNRQSFNSTTPEDNEPIKLMKPRRLTNSPRKRVCRRFVPFKWNPTRLRFVCAMRANPVDGLINRFFVQVSIVTAFRFCGNGNREHNVSSLKPSH